MGADVLVRAESCLAGFKAQQAEKPAVVAGNRSPAPPGCFHRPLHLSEAGPRRHGAAREPSQRRSDGIRSVAHGEIVTFHHSRQAPGRAND